MYEQQLKTNVTTEKKNSKQKEGVSLSLQETHSKTVYLLIQLRVKRSL